MGATADDVLFADGTDVPFAVALHPVWAAPPTPRQVFDAPVEEIPLDGLIATQPSLTVTRVLTPGTPTTVPIVADVSGQRYIYDGHKRLSKLKIGGAASAKCRVVSLPPLRSPVQEPERTGVEGERELTLQPVTAGPDRHTVALDDWDESKHPRGEHGKFSGSAATVKRGHNPGESHVTFPDGRQYVIYKDASSISGKWEAEGLENTTKSGAAFTKSEMLDHLGKLDESSRYVDKHSGIASPKTIKEHLDLGIRSRTKFKMSDDGEIAMAEPPHKGGPVKVDQHLVASVQVAVQSASDKLVASAMKEAVRLERAGWNPDEIEEALVAFLGEQSDGDLSRVANEEVNEAFAIGRLSAAEINKDNIELAVYSAILDRNTCETCAALDQQTFEVDSDDYNEVLPPNPNCDGADACRCTFIYVLAQDAGETYDQDVQ